MDKRPANHWGASGLPDDNDDDDDDDDDDNDDNDDDHDDHDDHDHDDGTLLAGRWIQWSGPYTPPRPALTMSVDDGDWGWWWW